MTKNKGTVTNIDEPMLIELDISDSALIIHDSGEISLFVPNLDDDDVVPDNVVRLSIIGVLLSNNDEEFIDFLNSRIKESADSIKEDEEN
jgi:hypothetical protein